MDQVDLTHGRSRWSEITRSRAGCPNPWPHPGCSAAARSRGGRRRRCPRRSRSRGADTARPRPGVRADGGHRPGCSAAAGSRGGRCRQASSAIVIARRRYGSASAGCVPSSSRTRPRLLSGARVWGWAGSVGLLGDGHRATQVRLGLGAAFPSWRSASPRLFERHQGLGVGGAVGLLGDGDRAAQVRLSLGQVPELPARRGRGC